MLDVAQDHLLTYLHGQGLFNEGLVFKGGTSLRKMRAGAAGRFSTDVDFCAPTTKLTTVVLDTIDGLSFGPFSFRLAERRPRRADLLVTGPFGPTHNTPTLIGITSKVDFSVRPPWLAPETLPFLPLPVHNSYDLPGGLPALPVIRLEEAVAEKLARYARVPLARDLYDLVWYGEYGDLDEQLTRRLWILKVYYDVVLEERWPNRAFTPEAVLTPRQPAEIDEENIGYLVQPVRIAAWEHQFRQRYTFLAELTEDERTWARCQAEDLTHHQRAIAALTELNRRSEPTG